MLLVQCLLVVTIVVSGVGLFLVCAFLHDIRDNQIQSNALMRRYISEFLGEYSDGTLYRLADNLEKVAKFAGDARRGQIPNLRYDDWYAKAEDYKRWEHAEIMAAASA